MNKFDIEIFTTSSAMQDDPRGQIARVLMTIRDTLLDEAEGPEDMDLFQVRDVNNVHVATVRVSP